jgi:tetratricopeptide (TPR) repeat protein
MAAREIHILKAVLLTWSFAACLLAHPGDPRPAQQYFEQGEKAVSEGRYGAAAEAYEKLRQLDPSSAEVHARLGLIYYQDHNFERAVPMLRQALKLKPGLASAAVLLALSLGELGRYTEALPGLENGFRRSADPALKRMAGLELQRAYTALRQHNKAVETAVELARLYPDDPEVLYQSGRVFGNYAYLTMSRLAQVAPDSVWRHQAAGEALESQGVFDRALSEYRQVLAIDPARPGIHFRLGRVLLARSRQPDADPEDLARATAELEQELKADPSNGNAAYELAEIARKSGEFDRARKWFELAVRYDPGFEEAQLGLGRTLLALSQAELALPHLRQAVTLDAGDDVAYYSLARAWLALGKAGEHQKALAEFQRLRSRKPRVPDLLTPREVTRQELDQKAER